MHWSMVSSTPLGDWPSLFFAEEIFVWLKLYLWETANTVGIGWFVGQIVKFVEYVSVLPVQKQCLETQ